MKKRVIINLLILFIGASFILSCKKDSVGPFVDVNGTTWNLHVTYTGYSTYDLMVKFNTGNRFSLPPSSTNVGDWSQSGNDVKLDFDANYHYKGTLVSADSVSGTMIDSTSLTPGVWTGKKQ